MVHVIQTVKGKVTQISSFLYAPGFNALEAATNLAKTLCYANGILFEGNISCDECVKKYSVQIFEIKDDN